MNIKLDNTDLSEREKEAVLKLKQRLKEILTVEHVILFGSTVRRERGPYSDIDILVLTNVPVVFREFSKIIDVAIDVSNEYDGIPINVVPFYVEDWERGLPSVTPFKKSVAKEGIYL